MPKFGEESLAALATAHPRLQEVANEVIKYFDFKVLEGHRGEAAQNDAYARGVTQVRWPNGKHNKKPSLAIDVAPWPIDWSNKEAAHQRFVLLAGFFLGIGAMLGYKLRWGGDWDGDRDTRDERFRDLPHIELLEP